MITLLLQILQDSNLDALRFVFSQQYLRARAFLATIEMFLFTLRKLYTKVYEV